MPNYLDLFSIYKKEIYNYGLLSKNNEKLLFKKLKLGDKNVFNVLVKSNLRYVISVARKYAKMGYPINDLINEGNIGLIMAIKRFNLDKNVDFAPYAYWWVRKLILSYIDIHNKPINYPLWAKNLDEKKNIETISTTNVDNDFLFDISDNYPIDAITKKYDIEAENYLINKMLSAVGYIDQEIIKYCFGICGYEKKTTVEIGKLFNLTSTRIGQRRDETILKLKKNVKYYAFN
jgi:RNA polymerase primary sigma factor